MNLREYLHQHVGKNWVVAHRKTERITQKRYREIELNYRALYGDPYDQVRAQMYLALVDAFAHIDKGCALSDKISAAIGAERTRR